MKPQSSARKTINMVDRLAAPTTLLYELGCVAYATIAAALMLVTLAALHHH